ncbi:MAG: hypothetical protein M1827_004465 [Pycnora praestabilis]|nr:MAG: hypothetical protein M1827_004465 [Pycnora praestabilis]
MTFFRPEKYLPVPTKDILSWIFDDPQYDVDKPIYIDVSDPSKSISCREARATIRKLAAGFRAAGLKKGDCVCLHAFNDIHYPIVFLGIIAAGGVFVGTNPAYTSFELTHQLRTAKARFIITEPETLEQISPSAKECNVPSSNIWIFDVLGQTVPSGSTSWKELQQHGEEDWPRFDDEETSKNTTAALFFSSGTTGLPKAAIWSHFILVAQHTLVQEANTRPYQISRMLSLPMFHAAIAPVAHTSTLKSGNSSYVQRRFDLKIFVESIEKYQVTDLLLVPPIVVGIVMSGLGQKYSLSSVRYGGVGAAPLDKDLQNRFGAVLDRKRKPSSPAAQFTQVFGMTETSCAALIVPWPEQDTTGSVGNLIPNLEAKLIDDNGNDVSAYDIRGELCLRGPTVITGYFENEDANKLSYDEEGFFKTGDIAYCDGKTKRWYIVDRKKELIKVRGFQVAPSEIEAVLLNHPDIIDAAVIGITSTHGNGEIPRAYVVRRPGKEDTTSEEILKKHCRERLASYKSLEGGIRFVNAIPKTASGKILKRSLREEAKVELEGNAKL